MKDTFTADKENRDVATGVDWLNGLLLSGPVRPHRKIVHYLNPYEKVL